MPSLQLRNFVFTDNNPKHPHTLYEGFSYIIYGEEVGASGTLHYQGYAELSTKKTISWIQNAMNAPLHIEARKGTQAEAIAYCKKDGKITELGEPKKQGERTDLKAAVQGILEKKTNVEELVLQNPMIYHQYGRTLEKVEELKLKGKPRTEPTKIIWYWGKTGSGKSRAAKEVAGESAYWHNFKKDWWEYAQEDYIIFDDYRGELKYNDLLRLADRYPYKVPIKNKTDRHINAKWLIITSPLQPHEIYRQQNDKKDSIDQLLRRIHEIKEFLIRVDEIKIDTP